MSAFSTLSSIHSYSTTPLTPHPSSSHLHSSPSFGLTTPPDSLRQYSQSLKESMRKKIELAKGSKSDDRKEVDHDAIYWEENPIDRHVRMYMTPQKPLDYITSGNSLMVETPNESHLPPLGASSASQAMDIDEDEPQPFRPTLLHFARTNSSSTRSGIPNFARGDSTVSDSNCETPGSNWSEASFEAIKSEDYISLYGETRRGDDKDRASMVSSASRDTIVAVTSRSTLTSTSRPSLLRPRPRAHPYPAEEKVGGGRQREVSGGRGTGEMLEVEEEEWMAGRSMSEMMVAQAGIRCQKGRQGRGVRC